MCRHNVFPFVTKVKLNTAIRNRVCTEALCLPFLAHLMNKYLIFLHQMCLLSAVYS